MDASKRGPYAKGKVRRKEILDAALTIVGSDGFDQTTLSKISEVVGISDVAVLHYFDSMDDLMIQVLKQRDLNDIQSTATSIPELIIQLLQYGDNPERSVQYLLDVIEHNAHTPGLVELFTRMSAKVTNPESPAYKYFKQRNKIQQIMLANVLQKLIDKEHLQTDMSADDISRSIQALLDGLQIQWLMDRSVDMRSIAGQAINRLLCRQAPANQDITEQ
ncbi:MAG: TetR/AcrR family transcriptional regulator [Bifidobacterium sp.]|jgi:AcrR family transcriptional regulator|nr:TetR/AcrR family transcriptional regulator [Bifidobacterium sp.]MCH4174532.1 TetR/AcrR family transcriptional regulator [Bifidobacterium sp.]